MKRIALLLIISACIIFEKQALSQPMPSRIDTVCQIICGVRKVYENWLHNYTESQEYYLGLVTVIKIDSLTYDGKIKILEKLSRSNPWPALSKDKGYIAYILSENKKENIWIYNLETGEKRKITNDSNPKKYLTWSNDGNEIYYLQHVNKWSIASVNIINNNINTVRVGDEYTDPLILPGDTLIMFCKTRKNQDTLLYSSDWDESSIYIGNISDSTSDKPLIPGMCGIARAPALSPDGKTIAFEYDPINELGGVCIMLVDIKTGKQTRILWYFTFWGASWLPDGNHLLIFDKHNPNQDKRELWAKHKYPGNQYINSLFSYQNAIGYDLTHYRSYTSLDIGIFDINGKIFNNVGWDCKFSDGKKLYVIDNIWPRGVDVKR